MVWVDAAGTVGVGNGPRPGVLNRKGKKVPWRQFLSTYTVRQPRLSRWGGSYSQAKGQSPLCYDLEEHWNNLWQKALQTWGLTCAGATFSVCRKPCRPLSWWPWGRKDRLGKISDPGAAEKWYGGHPSTMSEKELGKMADPQNTWTAWRWIFYNIIFVSLYC